MGNCTRVFLKINYLLLWKRKKGLSEDIPFSKLTTVLFQQDGDATKFFATGANGSC